MVFFVLCCPLKVLFPGKEEKRNVLPEVSFQLAFVSNNDCGFKKICEEMELHLTGRPT